ncbi:hydrolase [Eubacteriales bacterium KG127]
MQSRNLRVRREDAVLVAIDYQEMLMPVMSNIDILRDKVMRIVKGMGVLEIPAIFTEQYPKGLGKTENFEVFRAVLGDFPVVEKDSFSAFGGETFEDTLKATGKKTVLLCGIETHICVQQTAMDLLDKGYRVVLVVDCCSSRSETDKEIALRRMAAMGVEFVSVETILFEMISGNKDSEFKAISKIIK